MEQFVISIGVKISEYAVEPVGRWLFDSFRYSSNIQNMKSEEEKLRDAKSTVLRLTKAARRNGEELEGAVKRWLTKVGTETENVREVLEVEVKTGCSLGACLDVKRRHQQSRRAKKIAEAICNLRTEMVRFGTAVAYRPPPQELIPTDPDYMILASRRGYTEELLNALRDAENNVVGVWGMGGVGKTTLVEQVANQAMQEKLFDEMAIALVTPSPDPKRIQKEIAEMLGMKLDEESGTIVRASRLRKRIKQDEKTLIILDDIWKKLDLEKEIGIPSEGCKLILVSRNRNVLTAMGSKKDIELGVLSGQEAWSLFVKMGGNYVKNPNILPTATEVAEKCGGLPVALVTVCKALKNKDLPQWKDALRQLTRPVPGHVPYMLREVYMPIGLSYEHLECDDNDEFKYVFLLCALIMAYDIHFRDLLKYCYGLRLFRGIITVEDATNRLHSVIGALEASCLLQRSHPSDPDRFTMHDIVRDVGRHIASKNRNMLVMSHEGGWPDIDVLQRCEALSVLSRDICELPRGMECSKLRFFHVNNNDYLSLQKLDDFFEGLKNLIVLDLKRMQLPSLPPSAFVLTNLQTLCLDDCVLGDISLIGELKNLQVLSLHSSHITQLPIEVGLLTSLRLLDLSDCPELEVIPPKVLSSLTKLEELYMRNSFVQWEAEGLDTNERKNASLVELKRILSHLTTLEVHIPDSSILPKDLMFENLKRYKIIVGDVWCWDWSDEREGWRILKLDLKTSFEAEAGIKMQMQLKKSQRLFIDELKGITRFVEELDIEGFQDLMHLHIQNNVEIKRIISSSMSTIAFPVLEKIVLKKMISLEGICKGQLPTTSFGKLRVLKVEHCEKLKFVFSLSLARGLSLLEKLEIKKCSKICAILVKEGEGEIEDGDRDTIILFPRLRKLLLDGLPKLISFLISNAYEEIISDGNQLEFHMPVPEEKILKRFCIGHNIQFLSLKSLIIEHCPKLKSFICNPDRSGTTASEEVNANERPHNLVQPLFSEEVTFPSLENLRISHINVMEILWDNQFAANSFCKLQFLRVEACANLKSIFPSRMLEIIFQCLETLRIVDCCSLREVFDVEVPSLQETHVVTVTQLQNLHLTNLPKLKHIWNKDIGGILSFGNLHKVIAEGCESMKSVFPASVTKNLRKLEYLEIDKCGAKVIFEKEEGGEIATWMVQLKSLEVSQCKDMEEILLIENVEEEGKITSPKELFPRLEKLFLRDLPILKRFCIGHNIQFLSLKELIIEHCPKFISFIFNPDSLGTTAGEKVNANERAHNVGQPLFSEEVTFPSLENLRISHIDVMEILWDNQFAANSFCKLQLLRVEACANLKSIFPSRMLEIILQCLETLRIVDCCSLREVFDIEVPSFQETRAITTTQLKNLHLTYLPKLKHIWNKDPEGIFSFQNLKQVIVVGCEKIKSVFPASISKNLTQLKFLKIENCGVEVIIEKEEGGEVPATLEFPKLTSLELLSLPKLKCFFPGARPSNWPLLEVLCVLDCKGIEIFASKYSSFQETFQQRQPLFVVEEGAFPNLKELGLELNDTVWPSQLLEELFCKLEFLMVGSRDNSGFSASTFIGRLHNLKKLVVSSRYWEEMFPYEALVGQEKCATTLTNLREVVLFKMCMLTHLWKEDMQSCPIFHNLETLTVSKCGKLRNLVPSSVSFQNLTNLEISECHGLSELVTSSTAKSLVQLQNMSVTECKGITQIVAREGSEADEVITFSKLTHLKLDWLPKLTNFCSGSYSFMFPSLEKVIVRKCPEMKIFCAGVLSTPKLERVQAIKEDKLHWKDDLNTTIHWLWEGGS